MLNLGTVKVVLVLIVSASPARVFQGPTVCPANGPDGLRLGAWKPDSSAVDAARNLLARWHVDFITFDSPRIALEDTIAITLQRRLRDETDHVLLHLMLVGGGAGDPRPIEPVWAAAHFYVRLGLPRARLEDVLASPDAGPTVRATVFEALSATAEEARGVGLGRRWMVCDLARRMRSKGGLQPGERRLFESAVTILQGQARRGNTQAAELLEEASIRASRNRL